MVILCIHKIEEEEMDQNLRVCSEAFFFLTFHARHSFQQDSLVQPGKF